MPIKSKRIATCAAVVLLVFPTWACGPDASLDVRFVTPIATLETMFDAYGLANFSQEEVGRRTEIGRTFHVSDPATFRACFVDWHEERDEALAGCVFGSLLHAKDELIATVRDDEAEVMVADAEHRTRPIMLKRDEGTWRVVLARRVPESVRPALLTPKPK